MNKIKKVLLSSLLILFITNIGFAQNETKRIKKKNEETEIIVKDTTKPKITSLEKKIIGYKKTEGLFTIYQDTITGSIQLYIKKNQLNKEFIYQSFSMNGPTALNLNQSMHRNTDVFNIKKANNKIEFGLVNTAFYYDKNNAISKTAGIDISEAIFLSENIIAQDSLGYLIAADGLFLSDKLDPVKPLSPKDPNLDKVFSLGNFNASKSKYYNIRSFPNNTDVTVDLAYDNPTPRNNGGPDITDARYIRVRIQHTFLEIPKNNFKPRRDDPRIGYFGQKIDDLTSVDATPYKDIINRWYLTKKDPNAAISEPVEPIVWWVENTTPVEYRETILEAGNRWNLAFEKAGFKNAIVMKIQPDSVSWDAGDVRYNVIRWVSSSSPRYGAIGPSFANPKTGQILGADITIEWKSASFPIILENLYDTKGNSNETDSDHLFSNEEGYCSLANELKSQFMMGTTVADVNNSDPKTLIKLQKEFLYYLILHEMGHTLGLNHNMKASQMLSPSELNNTELTEKIGLIGSVMDYPAINISLDPSKQGNYYTTRPGPYDLWAIEYGYKEFDEKSETQELNKILERSTEPYLAFGNDADDMRSPGNGIDPRVMINDLSSDAITNSEDHFILINDVMTKLITKYSKPNQSYTELRARYNMLNRQRMQMTETVSRYIGGIYVDRSFVGQETNEKPFTPVAKTTQKRAMNVLNKYVFAPNAFKVDTPLFPYLQNQRRGFDFSSNTEDPKLSSIYLSIQTDGALAAILHPTTLQRISNSSLYGNSYSVYEVMNDLTTNIFKADLVGKVNLNRQYLQTSYVQKLIEIANIKGQKNNYDDVSISAARQILKNIKSMLTTATSTDNETRVHRANLVFLINNSQTVK